MTLETPTLPEQILRSSRWKFLGLIVLCGLFVAGGVWMGLTGPWIGWLIASFFGIGVALFAIALLPGSSYLHLSADGFEVCSLFRKMDYKWSDIEHFDVDYVSLNKMVVFDYSPAFSRWRKARSLSKSLFRWEGALHDNFGLRPEELATLMENYRKSAKLLEWSKEDGEDDSCE